MKRSFMLMLVVAFSALLNAQAPHDLEAQDVLHVGGNVRLTGGVSLHSPENVVLKADEAEYNQRTGETVLRGSVVLRQDLRPAS